MKNKKYILAVQGEGRGHITQALTTYDMLIEQGHEVVAVILGSSGNRDIPSFFVSRIKCPLIRLDSPNFTPDKKNKSIRMFRSVIDNVLKVRRYMKSMRRIDQIIREHEPDAVINFFDLLMGLYFRFYKPAAKMICIAHQYIYFHPDFEFPDGRWLDRVGIKWYTRMTASRSCKNLALSFYKIYTHSDVVVVPPLLRKELFELQPSTDDFYLVYLVNNGYFEDIMAWHRAHPGVTLHCFTDQASKLENQYDYNRNKLYLHEINDRLFLEMMSKSKGLASTAGFESVCEAMYLGKPVLMVPIAGHYEQFCNSRDAFKAGAGVFSDRFDLEKLDNYKQHDEQPSAWFRQWVDSARFRIYNEIISI